MLKQMRKQQNSRPPSLNHKSDLQQPPHYRDESNMTKAPRATLDTAANKAKGNLGKPSRSLMPKMKAVMFALP